MAAAKKIEIIQRENIKPSSSTPHDLKIHKLSLLDQIGPSTYVPVIFFFPTNDDGDHSDHHHAEASERSRKLKKSLSKTLTLFYPFAGRIKDNMLVECDDQGAEFIEARMNCLLSDILRNPYPDVLNQFLPVAIESHEAATGNLLLVQATFFDCGGLALAVCISHKIADATTLKTFMKCWVETATCSSSSDHKPALSPVFMGASIFPPTEAWIPTSPIDEMMKQKCIMKRFVFTASKIAALRAKVASTALPNPTRVEVVTGLLWKTTMTATRSKLGYSRPSVWSMVVNMRPRFLPPLPESFAGNCLGSIDLKAMDGDCEIELKELVGRIRKEKENFGENYVKQIQSEGALLVLCRLSKKARDRFMDNGIDKYGCSSWCKLELYDADFGWGRPVWISTDVLHVKNFACLMDARDGDGIEVWLTLGDEDMTFFESNEELLEFASVNPTVLPAV